MRNKIEKKIYEIVHGHNEELDLDKMWSKLAPQLEKPKKKRPIVFFFCIGMLLGLACIYLYSTKYFTSDLVTEKRGFGNQNMKSNSADEATLSQESENEYREATIESFATSDYYESLQKPTQISIKKSKEKSFVAINNKKQKIQFTPYNSTSVLKNIEPLKQETNEIYLQIKNDTNRFYNHLNSNLKNIISKDVPTIGVENAIVPIEHLVINNPVTALIHATDENEINGSGDQQNKILKNTNIEVSINNPQEIDSKNEGSKMKIEEEIVLDLPSANLQNRSHTVLFSSAYYYNLGRLYLKDNRLLNDFTSRKSQEKPLDAFGISLRYYRSILTEIKMGIGLNMIKIWDRHKYSETSIEMIPQNNVVTERLVTPNGIVETLGTQMIKKTTTQNISTYNQYQNWNIPIDILYQIGKNNVFVEIGVGVDIGFYKSYKGKIFYASSNYDLASDQSKILKRGMDLKLNAILGIKYNLSKSFDFVLRSKYVMPTQSIFNSSYGITHYQNLFGIETGINYNF